MSTDDVEDHLARVSEKLVVPVMDYIRARGVGATFHMEELVAFVARRDEVTSPDSPSRILRDLRRRGAVQYTVVSRRDSLYRVDGWDLSKVNDVRVTRRTTPTKEQLRAAVKTMRYAYRLAPSLFSADAVTVMKWLDEKSR